ncbi:helix-turn-helix domain-containing protein [Halobacteriales archaeon Cl-PHB]
MVRAQLDIELPEAAWANAVSTAYPAATIRVTSLLPQADRGVGIAELRAGDPARLIATMDDHPDIASLDLLWSRDDVAVVQFESTTRRLLVLASEAGVPPETPFDVTDGVVHWEMSTARERLADLGDHLEAAGLEFELASIREDTEPGSGIMTDRQRELFDAAVAMGYYETPRAATLTDVAAEMDVSKATVSDVLHRAEGAIVDWFVDEGRRGSRVAAVSDQ